MQSSRSAKMRILLTLEGNEQIDWNKVLSPLFNWSISSLCQLKERKETVYPLKKESVVWLLSHGRMWIVGNVGKTQEKHGHWYKEFVYLEMFQVLFAFSSYCTVCFCSFRHMRETHFGMESVFVIIAFTERCEWYRLESECESSLLLRWENGLNHRLNICLVRLYRRRMDGASQTNLLTADCLICVNFHFHFHFDLSILQTKQLSGECWPTGSP